MTMEELGTPPPRAHEEHGGDRKGTLRLLSEDRGETKRAQIPAPAGRGGAGSRQHRERRTDSSGGTQDVHGDPRESPKMRGARRSTERKVNDARGDLGPK